MKTILTTLIIFTSVVSPVVGGVVSIEAVNKNAILVNYERSNQANKSKIECVLRDEIENIVASGTKINIDYYINNILDEDAQEEVYDYFMEDAESDNIKEAFDEFDGDYSEEELRLMKIKFMSEMAN